MKITRIITAACLAFGLISCQQAAKEYTLVQYNVGAFHKYDSSSIEHIARAVREMGADAVGVNCSVGPNQLMAIVKNLKENLSIPVLVKPNAGIPEIDANGTAHYNMDEEEFARCMKELKEAGASVLGGCCGTTPQYIEKMCDNFC